MKITIFLLNFQLQIYGKIPHDDFCDLSTLILKCQNKILLNVLMSVIKILYLMR